mmetsp:Transcript_5745/g.21860  ORF Transcript_5745/g.21860 Transcript_5745/m.21860 type:complete len:200 (+) Transcript_5745:490-1089(+)
MALCAAPSWSKQAQREAQTANRPQAPHRRPPFPSPRTAPSDGGAPEVAGSSSVELVGSSAEASSRYALGSTSRRHAPLLVAQSMTHPQLSLLLAQRVRACLCSVPRLAAMAAEKARQLSRLAVQEVRTCLCSQTGLVAMAAETARHMSRLVSRKCRAHLGSRIDLGVVATQQVGHLHRRLVQKAPTRCAQVVAATESAW